MFLFAQDDDNFFVPNNPSDAQISEFKIVAWKEYISQAKTD